MKTIQISFVSFSDKIVFNLKNGIMPCDIIAEGPCWQLMEDDGIAYENSPFVYAVTRK